MGIFNRSKKTKPKQGHKLVWFSLIVIAVPCIIVGFVLFTSMGAQNNPVMGSRFSKSDLNPAISKSDQNKVSDTIKKNVGNIDKITVNLKSATLRINVDVADSMNQNDIAAMVDSIYDEVNAILPIDQYFTNREDAKMYDLEINVYNWMVDKNHLDDQIYIQCTKTGAGSKVVDVLTTPKDADLVNAITRDGTAVKEEPEMQQVQVTDEWGNPLFDDEGNPIYEEVPVEQNDEVVEE